MAQLVKKEVCRCVNCGNEAEMTFTCNLPETKHAPADDARKGEAGQRAAKEKVRATGTCTHCGNEADMWIEL
jgi:DNA-directed RNA polymerase subunit M/transcription elongation factor TFIIS